MSRARDRRPRLRPRRARERHDDVGDRGRAASAMRPRPASRRGARRRRAAPGRARAARAVRPPSGRCARSGCRARGSTSTTPPSIASSHQTAELDLDRRRSARWRAPLRSARRVTLQRPIASIRPSRRSAVERAHARRQRRARIGRVQLIELDALDAEGPPARLARRREVARAAVGIPLAAGPGHAALGRHDDARRGRRTTRRARARSGARCARPRTRRGRRRRPCRRSGRRRRARRG